MPGEPTDPRLAKLVALRAAVLARTTAATHPRLLAYLAKVRHRAHTITDAEVAAVLAAGHSEDEVFEHTVGTALGAAIERVGAGLEALTAALRDAGEGKRAP